MQTIKRNYDTINKVIKMGKFCTNCGTELKDNADICLSCGAKTHQNDFTSGSWGHQARELVVAKNMKETTEIVLKAIHDIKSFKVKRVDSEEHVIYVNVRMSMFSYGEKLTVYMKKIDENKTQLSFNSKSKLGTEIVANSKNRKNIENLINAINRYI